MKAAILSIWQPNFDDEMQHASLIRVFPEGNMKPTCRLCKVYRLGRVKRYRKKRLGTPVPYAAQMQNVVWTMDIIHDSWMNAVAKRIHRVFSCITATRLRRWRSVSHRVGCTAQNAHLHIRYQSGSTTLGDNAPAEGAAIKNASLMVPLSYQTGAD